MATQAKAQAIGLALSGGGFRSTLFGLGALHYLASSGHLTRLESIASVSGGSYTNAQAFLYEQDLKTIARKQFIGHFRPLVEGITERSVWWPLFGLFAVVVTTAISALLLLPGELWGVVGLGVLALLILGMPLWGRILERSIWRALFTRKGVKASEYAKLPLGKREPIERDTTGRIRRAKTMTLEAKDWEAREQTVLHMFCAADLHYTGFVYLSNLLVFNERLGLGSPGHYNLKDAVDASTAIPGIFAPVGLKTEGFLQPPGDAPKRLNTADGGVNDTLATEWYARGQAAPQVRRYLKSKSVDLSPEPTVLVVDGSTPVLPRDQIPFTTFPLVRWRIPVLWWVLGHVRSAFLAFSNWDRRNRENLRDDPENGLVPVSVNESPLDLVKRIAEDRSKHDRSDTTAKAIRVKQEKMLLASGTKWGGIVESNAEVPTRPKKLTQAQALDLMYHGFAMAWAVFTAQEDEPQELPSREGYRELWFGND